MSRLVCLVGEERMVTWANQNFDKVLREHKLPKNTIVVCGHGRLTFWRSTNRKDRWMVEIEKENELGLEKSSIIGSNESAIPTLSKKRPAKK